MKISLRSNVREKDTQYVMMDGGINKELRYN